MAIIEIDKGVSLKDNTVIIDLLKYDLRTKILTTRENILKHGSIRDFENELNYEVEFVNKGILLEKYEELTPHEKEIKIKVLEQNIKYIKNNFQFNSDILTPKLTRKIIKSEFNNLTDEAIDEIIQTVLQLSGDQFYSNLHLLSSLVNNIINLEKD